MATVDCSAEMTKYHKEKVTLQKSDQDDMRSRRNSGRTRLEKGLQRDGHPLPKETASQGSYAMRTMVQDDQCDYDIDDGAYFHKADLKDSSGNELTPHAARERVRKALNQDDRLKYDAENRENCVRQRYPEGYHIDIPVYRIVTWEGPDGKDVVEYQLASGNSWTKSDAREVTRWYNGLVGELNAGEADGSQMRRMTKLTKKLARSRLDWKNKTTSGICITKLVTECFVAKTDRDDESLHETLKAIKARLDKSTRIQHPVLTNKALAEEGDAEVCFLHDCIKGVLRDLEVLDDKQCTRKDALAAWDKAFNTSFFSDQLEESGSKAEAVAALFVVSKQPAQRKDDGRRFG
jgi:hypothetical protein